MKKGSLALGIILVLGVFITDACTPCPPFLGGNRRVRGSGIVDRMNLPLSSFRAVELQFGGDLIIKMADEAQLIVEAEDNLLPYLDAQVLDETLVIRKMPSNVTLDTRAPIRYYLTVTDLQSVTTTSSGSIQVPAVDATGFSITTKSSGDVYVNELYAAHLEVTVQAAGGVSIGGGMVEEQWVTLTSSGGYDGQGLMSVRARARLSGSGDAILLVRDRLEADLSSDGNLYYEGAPFVMGPNPSSEGRIIRIHECSDNAFSKRHHLLPLCPSGIMPKFKPMTSSCYLAEARFGRGDSEHGLWPQRPRPAGHESGVPQGKR